MNYDLVVKNGTIIDGSGGARYRADVGILDGKIASIGRIDSKKRKLLMLKDTLSRLGLSMVILIWMHKYFGIRSVLVLVITVLPVW